MLLLILYPQDDTRIARVALRWGARAAVARCAVRTGAVRLQQRNADPRLAVRSAHVRSLATRTARATLEAP